jgi:RNA polymerase subunit RPABC4/transcription elongation factor Spt4
VQVIATNAKGTTVTMSALRAEVTPDAIVVQAEDGSVGRFFRAPECGRHCTACGAALRASTDACPGCGRDARIAGWVLEGVGFFTVVSVET